jgi:hypothetical protein
MLTHLAVSVIATVIVPISVLSGVAAADGKVPLGGGAGITVNDTACTLTTIGHDKTGELTGFTASTCGGPGSPVTAGGVPVGSVVDTNDFLPYSVIKFEPAKVTPVANFAGFAINGIGPDPAPDEADCKQGNASGRDCGLVRPFSDSTPDRPVSRIQASFQQGDEGGPVTSGDRLVGMIYSGFFTFQGVPTLFRPVPPPSKPEIRLIYTSSILNDVNAKDVPGAGFSPVPA